MAETCHSQFCVVCAAGTARRRNDRPPPPPSRLARRPRRLTMLVTSEVSCDRRGRTRRLASWRGTVRRRARRGRPRTRSRPNATAAGPVQALAAVQASRETHREYAGRRPESLCCSLSSTPRHDLTVPYYSVGLFMRGASLQAAEWRGNAAVSEMTSRNFVRTNSVCAVNPANPSRAAFYLPFVFRRRLRRSSPSMLAAAIAA